MRKCLFCALALALSLLAGFFWSVGRLTLSLAPKVEISSAANQPETSSSAAEAADASRQRFASSAGSLPATNAQTLPGGQLSQFSQGLATTSALPGRATSCLNFMSIPSNAEESVRQVWKKDDSWLSCTKHAKSPKRKSHQLFCKTPHFPADEKGGEYGSYCPKRYTPPAVDTLLAGSYANECETFCVVRHPLERFLSLFRFLKPRAACDAKALRNFIDEDFRMARLLRYGHDCHFLPQAELIFAPGNGSRFCQHVLRYENLSMEFNALMARFDEKPRLKPLPNDARSNCDLQIPEDLLPTVWSHYASDFEAFGYAAPPGMAEALARLAPSKGKCLVFVHIPKTAGSSVEDTISGETLGPPYWGRMPWKSRFWGRKDDKLHCSAGVEMKGCASGPRCCKFKELGGPAHFNTCSIWHVPPNYDPVLFQSYQEDSCESFCVVRHPLSRWISQFNFQPGFKDHCNEAGVRKYFGNHFATYSTSKLMDDCHFLPQVDYVFGRKPGSQENGPRTCQHIVHFENLTAEFDDLMRRFDYPFRLRTHTHPLGVFRTCRVKLPADLEAQLRKIYADDFEALGYS